MGTKKRFHLIPDYGDVHDPAVRAKYGYLEGLVSILGNISLFIVKLAMGLLINSIALIADSVHTLSDVGTSLIVIIGFKVAAKPSDHQHPYGYGRVEYIATVIIAVLLVVTAFGFIQQSLERIFNTINITHQEYAVIIGIAVLLTAGVKEWMARFSLALGKKINSDALAADAWHHRSDALTSVGVGVSVIGSSYGFPLLDSLFGIIVSLIILYVGIQLGKTSANFLIGKSPEKETIETIQQIGHDIPGVKNIHDISLHDYGTNKIITLHAEVDKELRLEAAHDLADKLEEKIREKIHCSTIIHVEPTDFHRDTFLKKKIIESILRKQDWVISFHKISIIKGSGKDDISMHLVVNKEMNIQDSHDLCHRIERVMQRMYGSCDLHIHLEPCQQTDCASCNAPCTEKKGS
ncbi:MAG: cation-efflux pump [Candidatus Thermoplasmatota archaeon]|nr:cation-efflux pump [Candidatus Thermoplasmatota archaeon]